MVQDGILSVLPSWAEPYLRIDELPEPYQVSHSLKCYSQWWIFWSSVTLGDIKVGFYLRFIQTSVLAGITEEIGLFGLMALCSILFIIIWRIFRISRRIENPIYHLFTFRSCINDYNCISN